MHTYHPSNGSMGPEGLLRSLMLGGTMLVSLCVCERTSDKTR